MQQTRLCRVDFIRGLCAMGIVAYHYACSTDGMVNFLYQYRNGDWGDVLVTVFFIISGGVLITNNREIISVKDFYKKRWKAIFPLFYMCYIPFFILNVIKFNHLFYKGNVWSFFLTVIGMDGYLLWKVDNYYLIGEWFLGAIIILYFLYPILLWFKKKNEIVFVVGVLIAYSLFLSRTNSMEMNPFRSIISCLLSFVIGMELFEHRNILGKKWLFLCSVIEFCLLILFEIPINSNLASHLLGLSLFIILYRVGILFENSRFEKYIIFYSSLTYPVYLLHHQVIEKVIKYIYPSDKTYFWVGGVIFLISLLGAFFVLYGYKKCVKRYIK